MASDAPLFDPPTERRHNAGGETLFDKVLREIRGAGARGLTDEQLHRAFEEKGDKHREGSTRARRCELAKAGLVVEGPSKRKTSAGVEAAVWIAAEFAQAAAATPPVSRKTTPPPRTIQSSASTTCRHEPHERRTFDGYIRTECRRCGEVLATDRKPTPHDERAP